MVINGRGLYCGDETVSNVLRVRENALSGQYDNEGGGGGMGTVMGIDPSLTSTGWVVLRDGELIGHGTVGSKNDGAHRLIDLRDAVDGLLQKYLPNFVAIENYAFGAANRAHQIGEWGGVLRVLLCERDDDNCKWKEFAPTVVKKRCTGKGNSKKENMKLWAYKKWGVEFKTNDEVDAYVLAKLGEEALNGK